MLKAVCSNKELTETVFYNYIRDIINSPEIQRLKNFTHHHYTTRFQHCVNVSYYSFLICEKLGMNSRAAARAGLLHDLFYYNRKDYNSSKTKGQPSHSRFHSSEAALNAEKLFALSRLERDIIEKHMWPVTGRLPSYTESYVVSFVDKYCAVLEVIAPQLEKLGTAAFLRQKLLTSALFMV